MEDSKEVVQSKPSDAVATFQSIIHEFVTRKDIDPDRLEKFIDQQVRIKNILAEESYNRDFALFQGECPVIKRTKKTDFDSKTGGKVKYDYAPLDEIVFITKPFLVKYGFSFSFNIIEAQGQEKTSKLITTIHHREGHSRSFTTPFEPIHDDGRMNNFQRRKSAITYVKRAGLESALGIVTAGEDDDARRAVDLLASEEQIAEITDLIQKTGTDGQVFTEKFLKVDSLQDLSDAEAKKAITALRTKRSALQGKKL